MVKAGSLFAIPPTPPNEFTVVIIVAGKAVGVFGIEEELVDLFEKGRGEDLIAIEREDPVILGQLGGQVAQRTKADEWRFVNLDVGISPRDLKGFVGGPIIEKKHFRKRAGRLERLSQSGSAVLSQNTNRDHVR